jgi:excisionase family DNA binding protein
VALEQQPDFYTLDQIAAKLQVSVETVRVYLRRKKNSLKHYRIGKEYRVKREDFEEWLESQKGGDEGQ